MDYAREIQRIHEESTTERAALELRNVITRAVNARNAALANAEQLTASLGKLLESRGK